MVAPPALVRRQPARTARPRGRGSSSQKLGSYPRSRRRRRCRRRRPGRRVAGRTPNRALLLGGTLDLAIAPERRPRRRRGRVVAPQGLGRQRSGELRGRPRLRQDPLELGGHGRPDDAEQLGTSDRDFLLARRAGTLSFRPAGHPAPPQRQGAPLAEDLLMAPVGRRVLLSAAAASQSGSLGRATDPGRRLRVDPLEDRPLSCRRLPPG